MSGRMKDPGMGDVVVFTFVEDLSLVRLADVLEGGLVEGIERFCVVCVFPIQIDQIITQIGNQLPTLIKVE